MRTILKWLKIVVLIPFALLGLLMFAFLLWNSETGGGWSDWQAFKFCFFKPTKQ